jgi:hypothetical protein
MNTNQIPPGIVAFKALGLPRLLYLKDSTYHDTYETWAKMHLDNPGTSTIHTISVDGTQWSVGDNVQGMPPQNNKYKILGFKWKPELGWYIEVPMKGETSHILLSLVTKLPVKDSGGEEREAHIDQLINIFQPTPINPSEPGRSKEEMKFTFDQVMETLKQYVPKREYEVVYDAHIHFAKENNRLEKELQSLQAYNGKLVEALKFIRKDNTDNEYPSVYVEDICAKALSSFTDKTKDNEQQ